jgi:hypothetical protein
MNQRVVWPIAGVLGLAVLVVGITQLSAQRPPVNLRGTGPPTGRFVVADAGDDYVLILDSATGQVYRADEKDFNKMSALPKVGERLRQPALDRRPDFTKDKDKVGGPGRDRERFRDKDKDKGN